MVSAFLNDTLANLPNSAHSGGAGRSEPDGPRCDAMEAHAAQLPITSVPFPLLLHRAATWASTRSTRSRSRSAAAAASALSAAMWLDSHRDWTCPACSSSTTRVGPHGCALHRCLHRCLYKCLYGRDRGWASCGCAVGPRRAGCVRSAGVAERKERKKDLRPLPGVR